MIRILLLFVLLALCVGAVMLVTNGRPPRARSERQLTSKASTTLVVLGMVAVGIAIVLGFSAGDLWPLLPIAGWIALYLALRERARTRPQRQARRAEHSDDEFGPDGAELMDQADAAVARIMASEAATQNWLGELDFTADLTMIGDSLRKVAALRTTADEWAAIPNPTADDDRTLRDARRTATELEAAAAHRVEVLHDCAERAEQVDQALQHQREQAAIDERRDDVRSRLSAMIDTVDMTPDERASASTDAVQARVAAFLELKGIVEEQRRSQGR